MSIATNPEFSYQSPRYPGAFTESVFIVAIFHSNQTVNVTEPLTIDEANHFFNLHKFPDNFFRRPAPFDFPQIGEFNAKLFDIVGIAPGHNEGVNNYIVDETDDASVRLSCLSGVLLDGADSVHSSALFTTDRLT